jgi:hypothetical protein
METIWPGSPEPDRRNRQPEPELAGQLIMSIVAQARLRFAEELCEGLLDVAARVPSKTGHGGGPPARAIIRLLTFRRRSLRWLRQAGFLISAPFLAYVKYRCLEAQSSRDAFHG